MPTPATPFAGAAPRLSPARVIAVIATSVLVLFGVLLGGRAFIAAAGGPDAAARRPTSIAASATTNDHDVFHKVLLKEKLLKMLN